MLQEAATIMSRNSVIPFNVARGNFWDILIPFEINQSGSQISEYPVSEGAGCLVAWKFLFLFKAYSDYTEKKINLHFREK